MQVPNSSLNKPAHASQEDDTLSAFVDGELSDELKQVVLKRLASDPTERARYAAYCTIGDVLRNVPESHVDLTARVMAALEDEPTVMAPMRRAPDRRPMLWLAAAAVAAMTWGLWALSPSQEAAVPMASAQPGNVQALLAAHQDFTQAMVSSSELQFSRVSLAEPRP